MPDSNAARSIPTAPDIPCCSRGIIHRMGCLEPWRLMIHHPDARRTFRALDHRARDPSVSLEARAVWRIIDTFADKQGTGAFPSMARLSSLSGKNVRSIMRYVAELEKAGWLEVIRVTGKSNSYILFYGSQPVTKKARVTSDRNGSGTSDRNGILSHTSTQRADESSIPSA